VWAQLLGGNAPTLKFVAGEFIVKEFNENQARDELGRFSTEASGDSFDQVDAIDKIWTDGVAAALGKDPSVVSVYETKQGEELKAIVTKNIAEQMREFDSRRLAEVSLQGPVNKQLVDIALKSSEGVVGLENMNFVQVDDTGNLNVVTGMALLYNANNSNYENVTTSEAVAQLSEQREAENGWVLAGTTEAEEMVRSAAVSNLIAQWAQTSNNNSPIPLALQEIAAQTFGIQGHAGWDNLTGATLQQTDQMVAKNGDVLGSFLNAQYSATQDYLKSAGITSIELFRGMNVSSGVYAEIKANDYGVQELSTRPLTSWSTNDATAIKFGESDNGIFLKATIPADRIFSLPLTGVGCLNEQEVVVLGGRDNVIAGTVEGSYDVD
jgi:hypothetical protein